MKLFYEQIKWWWYSCYTTQ